MSTDPPSSPTLPDHPATGPLQARLPHRPIEGRAQFITFRLADALPSHLRFPHTRFPRRPQDPPSLLTRAIESALDQGHGSCLLGRRDIGRIVQDALLHWHNVRYTLHAWVVMPNHVHVLATPDDGHTLASIVQTWKVHTAIEANRALGRHGPLWQRDYFDRNIRGLRHFLLAVNYIEENPVQAGLSPDRFGWPLSSASVWK